MSEPKSLQRLLAVQALYQISINELSSENSIDSILETAIQQPGLEELKKKPHVTVAHITTGKYNIFLKIRAKGTEHAREIIFSIDDVEGVLRTETMISLEESINDKKRLMKSIFNEL